MKFFRNNNNQSVEYAALPQTISEINGVVVRQRSDPTETIAQCFGLPWEKRNHYSIHKLPINKVVKNEPKDPDGWEPTAEELDQLDAFIFAKERSNILFRVACTKLGCGYLRPLKMHISVAGSTGDVYVVNRPFKLGGGCCNPFEMYLDMTTDGGVRRIGRVRENYSPYPLKCCASLCCGMTYNEIEVLTTNEKYQRKYTLRTNTSCCGRVNNCCGGTCFRNDAVYDILAENGEIVAHLQKTYGRGKSCWKACCRMGFDYTNYILEFPPHSNAQERMLILTALFQVEYCLFEVK